MTEPARLSGRRHLTTPCARPRISVAFIRETWPRLSCVRWVMPGVRRLRCGFTFHFNRNEGPGHANERQEFLNRGRLDHDESFPARQLCSRPRRGYGGRFEGGRQAAAGDGRDVRAQRPQPAVSADTFGLRTGRPNVRPAVRCSEVSSTRPVSPCWCD